MKWAGMLLAVVMVLGVCGESHAQVGLYGSPELVPLPAPTSRPPAARSFGAAPRGVYSSGGQYPGGPLAMSPGQSIRLDIPAPPSPLPLPPPLPPLPPNQSLPGASGPGMPALIPAGQRMPPPGQNISLVNEMFGGSESYGPAIIGPRSGVPNGGTGQLTADIPDVEILTDHDPIFQPVGSPFARSCRMQRSASWFVSMSGLVMGRDVPNRLWTTYEAGARTNLLANTTDPEMTWRGGGEIRFGRWFSDGAWNVSATYWLLEPTDAFLSTTHASGVSTPLAVDRIEFAGVNGTALFDGATEHRLWRRNEFHNLEINVLRNRLFSDASHPVHLDWSAGVRFFRFQEDLKFGSLASGTWGGAGGLNEAYLDDRVVNNLVGFQMGFNADCDLTSKLRVFISPTVGIFNNYIENRFQAYRGDGTAASPTVGGGTYPIASTSTAISFLTQIDLGLDWQFAPHWSLFGGYRVVAFTGIALADNQIPPDIADITEIGAVDYNGNLILHGAFAGMSYDY